MRQPTPGGMSSTLCAIVTLALASHGYGQACEVLDDQPLFISPFGNNQNALSPVAVDGAWAIVGYSPPGKAYVVHRDADPPAGTPAWGAPVELLPADPPTNTFGKSVAIRGDVAIIGQSGNPGAVHLPIDRWAMDAGS